jgi:NTP pyrophosphatase (non-canonical NTP hydrolase)
MTTLGSFAAEQAAYLRARLRLGSNHELASVNVAKLAEETGEVASAYLALLGQQREEKLNGTEDDRRAAVGREVGDVIAVAVILAHAVGLDVDAVIAKRLHELEARRAAWLAQQALGERHDKDPREGADLPLP